jgi:hypothetical protein
MVDKTPLYFSRRFMSSKVLVSICLPALPTRPAPTHVCTHKASPVRQPKPDDPWPPPQPARRLPTKKVATHAFALVVCGAGRRKQQRQLSEKKKKTVVEGRYDNSAALCSAYVTVSSSAANCCHPPARTQLLRYHLSHALTRTSPLFVMGSLRLLLNF